MRCPDCNKFVPYDTEVDPEMDSEEVTHVVNADRTEGHANVSMNVRRVLTCEECGTELKEATFDVDEQLEVCACIVDKEPSDFDISVECSPTMDVVRTDRKGKPIKNPRYMTTLYGIEITGTITCSVCKEAWEFQHEDNLAASSFDELT